MNDAPTSESFKGLYRALAEYANWRSAVARSQLHKGSFMQHLLEVVNAPVLKG